MEDVFFKKWWQRCPSSPGFQLIRPVPWNGDIASSEQRAQSEPEWVGQREIVDVLFVSGELDGSPAGFGPTVDGEEDQWHGDEDGAHGSPNFGG